MYLYPFVCLYRDYVRFTIGAAHAVRLYWTDSLDDVRLISKWACRNTNPTPSPYAISFFVLNIVLGLTVAQVIFWTGA